MEKSYEFPLMQGIGSKSEAIVSKGNQVSRGQRIAKCPENQLGNNIHTSVSGIVEEVTANTVYIRSVGEQTTDYLPLQSETPLDLIREAGIIGLGGAGFPTATKLAHTFESEGVILVNAAECEPILTHNIERIEQHAAQIVKGIQIVMSVTHAKKAIIGIKGHHQQAITALNKEIDPTVMSIHPLPNLYPVGDERAIVRECLGKLIAVDELPLVANAIVINLETIARVQEAVELKKPLIDKDLTIAGKLVENGQIKPFLNVPLGMKIADLFLMAGGIGDDYGEIVRGGPFTGSRTGLDEVLTKTTGGLIATEDFWRGPEKIGLLVCACGAKSERMQEIADSMGSEVVQIEYCKQAISVKGQLKCQNPGICPGQVQKVMALKKAGAQALLISNCTDCSNTVMSCAPKMKLPVYHTTDGSLRSCNLKLFRKMKSS